jgi:uridine kinase
MTSSTYVIAISGPSGAGKSTIIQNLLSLFEDATSLHIDDYPQTVNYPPAIQWLENGANPDEFVTPQFFADVRALKNGEPIIHPESKSEIQPPAFLVIEEPFGKARAELRPLIDFHAEIDIPLEMALSRRLLRIIGESLVDENPNETIAFIKQHLEWYLRIGRKFYMAVREKASVESDLIIDGRLPSEIVAQKIFEAVSVKRSNQKV